MPEMEPAQIDAKVSLPDGIRESIEEAAESCDKTTNEPITEIALPNIATLLTLLSDVGVFRFIDERAQLEPMIALALADHIELLQQLLPNVPVRTHDAKNAPADGMIVLDCRPPRVAESGASTVSLFTDMVACFIAKAESLSWPESVGRRYFLLATPRSGSTFFCDLLTRTRSLGAPSEHLKPWVMHYLIAAGISFAALIDSLHRYSASSNGVFGSKIILSDLFAFPPGLRAEIFEELRRSTVFLLLRGDKRAQAISNVRSDRRSIYHVYEDEPDVGDISFEIDLAEVFAKERWLLRQEADIMELLSQRNVRFNILSYEACVQSRRTMAATLDAIATSVGVTLGNEVSWPRLIRIGTTLQPAELLQYNAFRATTLLYSTRSEPWLGAVLGSGWCNPENWGVRASPGRAEIRIRHPGRVRFVELLINVTPASPHHLNIGSAILKLARPATGLERWHWIGALQDAVPGIDTISIEFADGELELEEVVLYADLPPTIACRLQGNISVLISAAERKLTPGV